VGRGQDLIIGGYNYKYLIALLEALSSSLSLIDDYDIFNIDLTVARADELVASGIAGLIILDAGGASWSFKLFSTAKPAINVPADLDTGSVIYNLNNADLYISNEAAPPGTRPARVMVWYRRGP